MIKIGTKGGEKPPVYLEACYSAHKRKRKGCRLLPSLHTFLKPLCFHFLLALIALFTGLAGRRGVLQSIGSAVGRLPRTMNTLFPGVVALQNVDGPRGAAKSRLEEPA